MWGIEIRDVGYLHARSGAAQAWLLLGDRDRARTLAEAELADARVSGGRRALGIALRVAGLAAGGADVTLKTVETHLAHVYAKLGIARRGELPAALAGENLGVPTPTRTADR